ncbi:MAG TPA: hypothetical protein DEB46_09830 [Myxococcales bacterium]|nr:hypothetical protein [Myxococcales bacterium]
MRRSLNPDTDRVPMPWIQWFACALVFGSLACVAGPSEPLDAGPAEVPDAGPVDLSFEVPRVVLHEAFSGSNCGPCLEADANLQAVLEQRPDRYTLIHYQVGSDPYMSHESVARRFYYLPENAQSYGIPYLHVDGVNGMHPNEVNNDQGYLLENLDQFLQQPSFLRLESRHTVTDQTVAIQVGLEAGADDDSETLVLHVAILEGVTVNNVGSNGQTEFHHVMKKMLPNAEGRALPPLITGDRIGRSYNYTFQGDYNSETSRQNMVNHATEHTVEEFDDLEVLVWVQDSATKQVHQSAWSILE